MFSFALSSVGYLRTNHAETALPCPVFAKVVSAIFALCRRHPCDAALRALHECLPFKECINGWGRLRRRSVKERVPGGRGSERAQGGTPGHRLDKGGGSRHAEFRLHGTEVLSTACICLPAFCLPCHPIGFLPDGLPSHMHLPGSGPSQNQVLGLRGSYLKMPFATGVAFGGSYCFSRSPSVII